LAATKAKDLSAGPDEDAKAEEANQLEAKERRNKNETK
jgi:hypothetical protein